MVSPILRPASNCRSAMTGYTGTDQLDFWYSLVQTVWYLNWLGSVATLVCDYVAYLRLLAPADFVAVAALGVSRFLGHRRRNAFTGREVGLSLGRRLCRRAAAFKRGLLGRDKLGERVLVFPHNVVHLFVVE